MCDVFFFKILGLEVYDSTRLSSCSGSIFVKPGRM